MWSYTTAFSTAILVSNRFCVDILTPFLLVLKTRLQFRDAHARNPSAPSVDLSFLSSHLYFGLQQVSSLKYNPNSVTQTPLYFESSLATFLILNTTWFVFLWFISPIQTTSLYNEYGVISPFHHFLTNCFPLLCLVLLGF